MEGLNPIEVFEELMKNKDDDIMEVFGEDYIAMTETIIETLEPYGYELKVIKK